MVVCVCNAIKERDVHAAIDQGVQTAAQVYALYNRRPKCGQCCRFVESLLAQATQPPCAA